MIAKSDGIESSVEVSGGDACIARTRIPVWALVRYRQLGAGDADLLQWYPTLTLKDIHTAWSYYQSHQEEIDQQITENEAA